VSTADWKLLVFREGRSVRSGSELLHGLIAQIETVLSLSDLTSQFGRDELIDALLRAGELECGLADSGCRREAELLGKAADDFALALITKSRPQIPPDLARVLEQLRLPQTLTLSTPEGFCYYALHPLDYVDLLNESEISAPAAAVIGIRSIGTTLSAVVRAWFCTKGIPAERISVRPVGHPFDRRLSLNDDEHRWIAAQNQREAQFLIVDEGPGLSGSSFLAVAEALVKAGVAHDRITLMPSSAPQFDNLLASNVAQRWSRFRTIPLKPTRYIPPEAGEYIGGGSWRGRVFNSEVDWPGVWPWTERQKYLSRAGNTVFRFDGHGHYGKAVRNRSNIVAGQGWGPAISSAGDGFSASPWLIGTRPKSVTSDIVLQLARYCAFRAEALPSSVGPQTELEQMAQINLERALAVARRIHLPIERPVVADARMMPYEWIQLTDSRLQKLDAADHGDSHFFPGPTDIAWDLAGAIVEWRLDGEAAELLTREYRGITKDPIEKRLPNYLIAYSCFRMAFTQSAANSTPERAESLRLQSEAAHYSNTVLQLLNASPTQIGSGASRGRS
jgi:hypothetical protein